jgi:hypothetical protein
MEAPTGHEFDRDQFERRLRDLDPSLFRPVGSQTSGKDKIALLALHGACREVHGSFRYLEIGSHLGGTLQPFLADDRCTEATSIDSRPEQVDDVRGMVEYPGNTTERMLAALSAVPGADLTKLRTIEATTEGLETDGLEAELCLVDGEHTHEAALRDARFCRDVLRGSGTIAFHDCSLVQSAIDAFTAELEPGSFTALRLPGVMFAVELGSAGVLDAAPVRRLWDEDMEWLWRRRK